ncbi:MAG: hypothetical protein SFU85_04590 [Candidatus Methylacidiphilales bacterium]|nr:hypothetical protein [Candidatus Methylacidiphilales bacterium]
MAQTTDSLDRKKRLRPKVYAIGIYVVALFIVVEILVLGSAFWMRQRVILETEGPTLVETERPEKKPEPTSVEALKMPDLPPARLPVDSPRSVDSEIVRLNDEARNFRRNGDFAMAEAALKKAQALQPIHPLTLTNLAMLEEAQGRNTRALEYWKEVIALGDRAKDTIQLARERSVVIEERLRLEEESRRAALAQQEGRHLALESVTTQPDPLPVKPVEIQRDFVLRAVPGSDPIQASKVRVQVYFYERIGTDRLVSVPIEARFLNPSPDWNAQTAETLRVRYTAVRETGEPRIYYGYIFRLYYDGELQEERAEPSTLLRLNPSR